MKAKQVVGWTFVYLCAVLGFAAGGALAIVAASFIIGALGGFR